MEIECVNKCGNLTDSPTFIECETCRESEATNQDKFLNLILKLLHDSGDISPTHQIVYDGAALICHAHQEFKLTIEEKPKE